MFKGLAIFEQIRQGEGLLVGMRLPQQTQFIIILAAIIKVSACGIAKAAFTTNSKTDACARARRAFFWAELWILFA